MEFIALYLMLCAICLLASYAIWGVFDMLIELFRGLRAKRLNRLYEVLRG